jgi:hypothetical protein
MKTLTLRSSLPVALAAGLFAGAAFAGEVVIHKQPNFSGGALTLRNSSTNLTGSGFQDQASSIEVRSGRWQFCSQPDFNGDCVTLDSGKYATLDQKINHRIESARELAVVADNTAVRKSYHAERYERERAREEAYARERDREERSANRYPERYAEDRYTYPGSRW